MVSLSLITRDEIVPVTWDFSKLEIQTVSDIRKSLCKIYAENV
jgi:hypothetical protein